jgi:hypothetical protein
MPAISKQSSFLPLSVPALNHPGRIPAPGGGSEWSGISDPLLLAFEK